VLLNIIHPGRVLVGSESEFPRKTRAEKRAAKEAKKRAKEEKKARKGNKSKESVDTDIGRSYSEEA
jgi:hypothetical protein